MKEFELINFLKNSAPGPGFSAIGDDCAVIEGDWLASDSYLLLSTDSMIEGRHFLRSQTSGTDLGWKVMAQAASDIAAMGGKPMVALISLTLPEVAPDDDYIKQIYSGIAEFNDRYDTSLVGGDTCLGKDFSMALTFVGNCSSRPVLRSGASKGDQIWVSGTIGLAGKGLALSQGKFDTNLEQSDLKRIENCFQRPSPRIELGDKLLGLATAMIDVSDGLISDLGLICEASSQSAQIELDDVPVHNIDSGDELSTLRACSAGEDYELLFTAPAEKNTSVREISKNLNQPVTLIGQVGANTTRPKLLIHSQGVISQAEKLLESHGLPPRGGWEHTA